MLHPAGRHLVTALLRLGELLFHEDAVFAFGARVRSIIDAETKCAMLELL